MHAVTMPEHHFQDIQHAFAASIRTPGRAPTPAGVPIRRMAVYGELFFANISEQLATTFPVLHAISPDDYWQSLCRDFFASHRCISPLFHEVPREFLIWLEQERIPSATDPACLLELAHYEWVELALSLAEDELPAQQPLPHDVLSRIPQLSPLAWSLSYRFPVHRIGPSAQSTQIDAIPTHLLVYRDRRDAIHFMELNVVSARLLQMIGAGCGMDGEELLRRIAAELQHPDPATVFDSGSELLRTLYHCDVLL